MSLPNSCVSGSPPFALPQILDPTTGLVSCMQGFYCGHLDSRNTSTYPVACTPTIDCSTQRFFGQICDEVQSPYEPKLCPGGYYCPNATTKKECPSGHFCPTGSTAPYKCPGTAICPDGSKKPRDLGPLLALVIVFILVAIIRFAYLRVWRLRGHAPGERSKLLSTLSHTQAVNIRSHALSEHYGAPSTSPDGEKLAISINFHNLRVELPPIQGQKRGKVLLEGVSGSLRPGTVTAIMGPSGSGKTVLLTTLLQRIDPSWKVEGAMRINGGKMQLHELRSFIGFVPQDDILHKELTVDANLYYASELRLPRDWPSERRAALREAVLDALDLLPDRTTIIGDENDRGLSGGQRKRTSIGVELASAPLLVFLDEPTSGLDSTTAMELVQVLKAVAVAANITVAMVIHQPRVEIWNALDDLLLLAGGRTIYRGPQASAEAYFASVGVEFNVFHNPADDIMDYAAVHSDALVAAWATQENANAPVTPLAVATTGSAAFHGAGPVKQFGLFVMRSLEKQLSNITSLIVEAFVIALCGIVLGYATSSFLLLPVYKAPYDRISPSWYNLLLPQLHMYQLMSLGLAASVAGVSVFSVERLQYFREVPTGMWRISYFAGNVTAALLRVFICSLTYAALFTALAMLVVDFQYLYFTAMLSYRGIYGLGACIAVVVPASSASLIAATASIVFAVFNGFIDFPVITKQLTFGFYASQILQEQHAKYALAWAEDPMASDSTGYEYGVVSRSYGILVVMCFGAHVIAFLLMIGTNRDRQR